MRMHDQIERGKRKRGRRWRLGDNEKRKREREKERNEVACRERFGHGNFREAPMNKIEIGRGQGYGKF